MCYCSVRHCSVRQGQMFSLPKDIELQEVWLTVCGRKREEFKCIENVRVCRKHFEDKCIVQHITKTRKILQKLKIGSIPTLYLNLEKSKHKRIFNYWTQMEKLKEEPPNKIPCNGIPSLEELRPDTLPVDDSLDESEEVDEWGDIVESYRIPLTEISEADELELLREQNILLRERNAAQIETIETLEQEVEKLRTSHEVLEEIFTKCQMEQLLCRNPSKKRWSEQDIVSVKTALKNTDEMQKEGKKSLPCEPTLRKWITSHIEPGLLGEVISVMKEKGQTMSKVQKVTILTFDEIHLSKGDNEKKDVTNPEKKCQIVMAHGLFMSWKEPIFYKFNQPMTKDILEHIIKSLFDIDYIVIGISNDMKPSNMSLWNDLSINENKSFFSHPSDTKQKIFVFADVLYLIKQIRNNFISSGFVVNGVVLTTNVFEELLDLNSGNCKTALKLSKRHLNLKSLEHQQLNLSIQLFSLINSRVIEYHGQKGVLKSPNWKEMSNMICLINSWFELLNSSTNMYGHNDTQAYGIDIEKQSKILDDMSQFAESMRVLDKKTGKGQSYLYPFQIGIMLTNKSLKQLLDYVKVTFSDETSQPTYIFTKRLCQDILQDYVAKMKAMGGFNGELTPFNFQKKLKWTLLFQHSSEFQSKQNVELNSVGNTDIDYKN